jgi:hypothetical protein
MPFAVVGYYDQHIDKKISLLWKGMADIGVDNYLIHSENRAASSLINYHRKSRLQKLFHTLIFARTLRNLFPL